MLKAYLDALDVRQPPPHPPFTVARSNRLVLLYPTITHPLIRLVLLYPPIIHPLLKSYLLFHESVR